MQAKLKEQLLSQRFLRFFLVAVVLVIGVIFTLSQLQGYFEVEEMNLPDVVGLDQATAIRVLEEMGLDALSFPENVSSASINEVTSQSPKSGSVVREGRSVSIGVNEPVANSRVPLLIESSEEQAVTVLADLGFELGEVSFVFDAAPEGQIIAQTPESGSSLAAGENVDIIISRGPNIPVIKMPEVRGVNVEVAKRRLSDIGLKNIELVASEVSFERPNTVSQQLPAAGQNIAVSTRVTLAYAMEANRVIQVPYVLGMPLDRARTLLESSRLRIGSVNYINDVEQPGGIVSYKPAAYTLAGSPVGLTINSAKPASAGPISAFPNQSGVTTRPQFDPGQFLPSLDSPEAPPEPQVESEPALAPGERRIQFNFDPKALGMQSLMSREYKLSLVVTDDQGQRKVLERVMPAGEPVEEAISIYGDALLQTYINDLLFQAWNP